MAKNSWTEISCFTEKFPPATYVHIYIFPPLKKFSFSYYAFKCTCTHLRTATPFLTVYFLLSRTFLLSYMREHISLFSIYAVRTYLTYKIVLNIRTRIFPFHCSNNPHSFQLPSKVCTIKT